jgi:hypothetical protein
MTSQNAHGSWQVIDLTPAEVAEATRMGLETYERWRGRPGHYRNLEKSHRLGKLGEVAIARWATESGVQPIECLYEDGAREREADLVLGAVLVDVKTWSASTWPAWGRCVATSQLAALKRKAAAIIWTFTEERDGQVRVTIVGWSTMQDIEAAPVKSTGPQHALVINHQVEPNNIRKPEALISGLLQGKTLR